MSQITSKDVDGLIVSMKPEPNRCPMCHHTLESGKWKFYKKVMYCPECIKRIES